MLALIGNLDFFEIVVILVVAVIVFGDRLPEVAMRGAAQLVRLRRTVMQMWRDAGLEDELRRVQREIDLDASKLKQPKDYFASKVKGFVDEQDAALDKESESESEDPDAGRADERTSGIAVGTAAYAARESLENEPHLLVDHPLEDRREPESVAETETPADDAGAPEDPAASGAAEDPTASGAAEDAGEGPDGEDDEASDRETA
ncbi:MAG: hypothetical protein GY711_07525 [bacterium]|nr:hypothetical protein [bacterium]